MGVPERVDAVLLRRSHVMRNVGVGIALAGFAIAVASHGDARLIWFVGLVTVGGALALLGLEGSVCRVSASLDAVGVRAGGEIVAPGDTIRSGWIERGPEGSTVYLDRGLRPAVRLEARDDTEAHALLRALSRDPSQALVRFSSASHAALIGGGVAGQLMAHGLLGHGRPADLPFLAAATLFLITRFEMTIGSDGVLLAGPVRSRFVPFCDIESAVVEELGKVVMRTRTHGTIIHRLRAAAAEAAVEQIQSSMASVGGRAGPVRQQHRRDGPNVQAWLARLRALAGRGSYRVAGLVGDALWRVMDDPGATGAERGPGAAPGGAPPPARSRRADRLAPGAGRHPARSRPDRRGRARGSPGSNRRHGGRERALSALVPGWLQAGTSAASARLLPGLGPAGTMTLARLEPVITVFSRWHEPKRT